MTSDVLTIRRLAMKRKGSCPESGAEVSQDYTDSEKSSSSEPESDNEQY